MFTKAISGPAYKALELIQKTSLLDNFYLGGGTALAIQLGHRISIDLDFFAETEFDEEEHAIQIEQIIEGSKDLELSPGTVKCNIEGANISFFYYPYKVISKKVDFENIKLASTLDIALMKLTAIASRGSKKDFIDLFFILKIVEPRILFDSFKEKFPIEKIDKYHYIKSLVYFDEAEKEPDPEMLVEWDWEEIKKYLRSIAKEVVI